jgi:hypothetical protein
MAVEFEIHDNIINSESIQMYSGAQTLFWKAPPRYWCACCDQPGL